MISFRFCLNLGVYIATTLTKCQYNNGEKRKESKITCYKSQNKMPTKHWHIVHKSCYNIYMSDQIHQTLTQLGLNEKEIDIYLALLKSGSSPASMLGQRTDITRSTAQYTCQQLVKKGLVTAIENNNTFIYTPENPDKLIFLIEQEKKNLEKKEDKVERILGDLKSMLNPSAKLPKVKFLQGVDGVISAFEDALESNDVIYSAAIISDDMHPEIIDYVRNTYIPKRQKDQRQTYVIFNDSELTKNYQNTDKKVNRTSLLVPEEDFPFPACLYIYANKVSFLSYKKNDMIGVIIENEFIHRTMMSIFKLAWNQSLQLPINQKYSDLAF
ncbi:hypothetical protein GF376_00675 [Candidatus Peregrinibacteria bacterium]|nr:hypothetical protein [Candidatus Peregrinibacteria bacterium]